MLTNSYFNIKSPYPGILNYQTFFQQLRIFAAMNSKLPIGNLHRMNLLLSVVISAIVCVFLVLGEAQLNAFFITAMTAINIAVIGYGNVFVLIVLARRFEINSRRFKSYRYLLSYTISALIYLITWPLSASLSGDPTQYVVSRFLVLILGSALANSLIVILDNFIILMNEKNHADLELAKFKTANAEAVNLLLRQQIHPHFLFNALSTVKALYRNDSRAGDAYIIHLANFLRASVFYHTAKVSKLEAELNLLKDYLEMQKIRFGSALNCTIKIADEDTQNYNLPTFSLQPLLENAIKHNELTEKSPLHVLISRQEDRIVVENNLQKKTLSTLSSGQGLANLVERYRLLSGDEVIIREENKTFLVSIKLL